MSQILIRDLDPAFVEQLKERARKNRRSLAAEVKVILETAVPRRKTPEERKAAADRLIAYSEWARSQAEGVPQTDSTEEIRRYRGPLGS